MKTKPAYVKISSSPIDGKKLRATFYDSDKKEIKHRDFGSSGMSDYTIHKDDKRKERWLSRFNSHIQKYKGDPTKRMTLAHLILWNKQSKEASISDYLRRFNLKKL